MHCFTGFSSRTITFLNFYQWPYYDYYNPQTFHYADENCLLSIKYSFKQINKVANKDFKFLFQWFNAHTICVNLAKTEVNIFRERTNLLSNIKSILKTFKLSIYVRYLGIYLDEYLNWSPDTNHLRHKLVKVISMSLKLCHLVNVATIKSIKKLFLIPSFIFLYCMR